MNDQTPPSGGSFPTAPLVHQTAPAAPRWPGYVAWILIWGIVITLAIANMRGAAKEAASGATGAVQGIQLRVAAKSLEGLQSIESGPTSAPASVDIERRQLLEQIETLSKTPQQQMWVAILFGDIEGAKSGQTRLDALSKSNDLPPRLSEEIESLKTVYASGPAALTDHQRDQLLQNEGYFGQIAVSYGLPPTHPTRSQVLAQGRKMLLLSTVTAIVGGVGGLVSLGLFVLAIVLLTTHAIRTRYAPQPGSTTVYVEMFAVWFIAYLALDLLSSWISGARLSLVWVWLVVLSLPIAFAWGRLRGEGWSEIRRAIGWHGGRGWYVEIPLGVVGYLAGGPIIFVGMGITLLLIWISKVTPSHPIMVEPTSSRRDVLLLYALASVMAPIVEETMFRGALFHHLRQRWNWLISSSVVAILFATIHPQGWTTIPALASIAIVLAGIREWRGSILGPMAAHALHNGILVTLLVLTT